MRRPRLLPLLLLAPLAFAGPEPEPKPPPDAKAKEAARAALGLADPEQLLVRLEALETVAAAGERSAVPLLFLAAVQTQEPGLAVRAGEIANALDPEAAFRAFDEGGKSLKGKKFSYANAIRFLGEVKHARVGPQLVEAYKDKDRAARVEALYAMVKQGDEAFHAHFLHAMKSPEPEIRVVGAICAGLAKAKGARDALLQGLGDDANDFSFFCAWALGQLKDPAILDKAIAATKGKMAGRTGVAKAKAVLECAFDAQAHLPALIRLSASNDELLAGAAAGALGRIGAGNPEAADALLDLATRARAQSLLDLAVDNLGRIGGPAHGEKLLARYENNPGNIPSPMVKALGLLRAPKAAAFLLHLSETHKDAPVRKRAAIAFWQCADDGARKKFEADLLSAAQEKQENRVRTLCTILGFDRTDAGFQFAVRLLREFYGRKYVSHVRDALERMTGHRFAPAGKIWSDWYAKNADFFSKKPQLLNRDEWRQQVLTEKQDMGISRKTEEAVERGLGWLSRHQASDGRWSGDKFTDCCDSYYGKKCQIGARLGDWDLGMTGISVLAFYGAGYRGDQGRYKDTVLRAQVYCAARQWADGDFGGQDDLIGGYQRPIAAIALAEAYGTSSNEEYLERTRRSVAHIIRIQYPDAGWRYRLSGQFPGDTSVTGWNAWAIATARKFGVPVDPMGLEGSNSLLDLFSSDVTQDEEYFDIDPRYFFEVGRGQKFEHFTGYNAREASRPPMTALGLMCKIMMDRRRSHPYCIGAANTLTRCIPEYDEKNNRIKYQAGAEYPFYYYYYGSLAMYQMGGTFWRKWSRPLLTEGIPNTQVKGDTCDRGSWGCDNLDSIGGRVYTTALGVLTLETFYRYLPILQGH